MVRGGARRGTKEESASQSPQDDDDWGGSGEPRCAREDPALEIGLCAPHAPLMCAMGSGASSISSCTAGFSAQGGQSKRSNGTFPPVVSVVSYNQSFQNAPYALAPSCHAQVVRDVLIHAGVPSSVAERTSSAVALRRTL